MAKTLLLMIGSLAVFLFIEVGSCPRFLASGPSQESRLNIDAEDPYAGPLLSVTASGPPFSVFDLRTFWRFSQTAHTESLGK